MTNNITALREELERLRLRPSSLGREVGYLEFAINNANTLINALKVVEAALVVEESRWGADVVEQQDALDALYISLAALNPTTPSSSTQER